MVDLDRDDAKLDIHHIFPKKWCEDRGIPPRVDNAIVERAMGKASAGASAVVADDGEVEDEEEETVSL
jgi:hypothetical protein